MKTTTIYYMIGKRKFNKVVSEKIGHEDTYELGVLNAIEEILEKRDTVITKLDRKKYSI